MSLELIKKIKEHFLEFFVVSCLLFGLLYAITTTYKISIELEYTQKREETLKSNIKAIKGALYLVMSKTEGLCIVPHLITNIHKHQQKHQQKFMIIF